MAARAKKAARKQRTAPGKAAFKGASAKKAASKKAASKKAAPKTAALRTAGGAAFPGFSAKAMTWLRQIPKNNDRDWFMAHKPTFETEVKAGTETLVAALASKMAAFAPAYAPADPKKAVMRVYRDVRFSKDKSPYKTEMSAKFGQAGGGPSDCAGFWVAVSAKGVDVVGGSFAPGGPQLANLRAYIATHHRTLEALLKRKTLRTTMGDLQGDTLQRIPRGFDTEHPAADLLRHKQFYLHAHLPAKLITTPDLQKEILRRFKLLLPFVEFLNVAIAKTGISKTSP